MPTPIQAAPAQSAGNTAWLRRYQPADQAPKRLFCFPHAGGSATFYFPVARALAPEVDVLAVQYPGRQDRHAEPGITDLSRLADLVAEQIHPWADRPLSFFGHSMGATLAFEVAHRLGSRGVEIQTLFASGRRAPGTRREESVHLRSDSGVIADVKRLSRT